MPSAKPFNPLAGLDLPPLLEMSAAEALEKAGYNLDDGHDALAGMAAFAAAVRVYNAAFPPREPKQPRKVGRNDPCPCGSGRKYKKCCARSPEPETAPRAPHRAPNVDPFDLIPRLFPTDGDPEEDLRVLSRIFQEDPGLREVRFGKDRLREFLLGELRGKTEEDRTPDLYRELMRRYLREVEPPASLGDLKQKVLEAAPRWRDDPAALRAMAAGVALELLAEAMAEETPSVADDPTPLDLIVYELTITNMVEAQVRWPEWVEGMGGPDALRQHLARGQPLPLEGLPLDAAEAIPDEVREAAEEHLQELVEEILAEGLPQGLPFASVLPCLVRFALLVRETPKPARQEVTRIFLETAEELGREDAELFDEFLDQWVLEHGDEADEPTLKRIGSVRNLLAGGDIPAPLGSALLLHALKRGSEGFSDLEGAPALAAEDGESATGALSPEFLERYGDFLWEQALPDMARRTWNLCRLFGPLPPSVDEKLSRWEAGRLRG
ncbi:SEC-C metal-binding domain-containing protein [Deferrisoma palaeochoriense]